MRRTTTTLAVLAASIALPLAAACSSPGPTESRRPTESRLDEQDTTKRCGGMIGSGTVTC